MKANRISILALASIILAVLSIGNASALTWNGQTDVSVMQTSPWWYFTIGDTGTATTGQQVTWANGFNNWESGWTFKPKVIWYENVNGLGWTPGSQFDSSTIGYNQAWGINENTTYTATKNSAPDLEVWHAYYDSTCQSSYVTTSECDQYYSVN